jgi:signal transduction histidine kinase
VEGEPQLPPGADAELLRIVQEALQNALRHSQAERLEVSLEARDGAVSLRVSDDGVGVDPRAPGLRARRLGLTSMEERARSVGGRLEIRSRPGEGTTIALEVPR